MEETSGSKAPADRDSLPPEVRSSPAGSSSSSAPDNKDPSSIPPVKNEDVGLRSTKSQIKPSEGDAGHSKDLERQGRGALYNVSDRQKARAQARRFHSKDREREMVQEHGASSYGIRDRQQARAQSRDLSSGFHAGQNYNPSRSGGMNKNAGITARATPSGSKQIWRPKLKPANDESSKTGADAEAIKQPNQENADATSSAEAKDSSLDPEAIKQFLSQRWTEALEGEHVIYSPSSDSDPPSDSAKGVNLGRKPGQ